MQRTDLWRRGGVLGVLLLATLFLCLPLLTHTALPFGSDLGFASHSAHGFVQALGDGVLYPRWIDNSNRGFGGPTFIFYCPLPYYAVAAAYVITGDMISAFRLVLVLAALLAGLTFFVAARPLSSHAGALAGAVFYVVAPYHALDLFDRFAFAEYMAFIWFPLLFHFSRRLLQGRSRMAWMALAASFAGLAFTHLVTSYMVLLVLGPYAVVMAARRGAWRRLLPLAGAGAVGLMLAAVFILPMLRQRSMVHLEFVVDAPYGNWRRNFVYRDEVAMGFAPAPIKPWVNGSATTQGLLSAAAGGILVLGWWWRRRHASSAPQQRELAPQAASTSPAAESEGTVWACLAAWTFFLQLPPSAPLWAVVPELETVQFPWRFGLFQALAASFLVACALAVGQPQGGAAAAPSGRRHWLSVLAAVVIAIASLPALLLTWRLTAASDMRVDANLASHPLVFGRVMDEYLPRDFAAWSKFKSAPFALESQPVFRAPAQVAEVGRHPGQRLLTVTSATANTIAFPSIAAPGWRAWVNGEETPVHVGADPPAIAIGLPAGTSNITLEARQAILDGQGRVIVEEWTSAARLLAVEATAATVLRLRTFYYPGWRAWLDEAEHPISADSVSHMIRLDIPAGRHQVRLAFTPTADQRAGAVISLLTLATMLVFGGSAWRQRR